MAQENNNSGLTAVVAWIALILAIFGTILAWSAYNQVGDDLLDDIGQQINEATQEFQQELTLTRTRADLIALRAEVAAEENYEELAAETREIRLELEEEYAEFDAEAQQQIDEILNNLETLETDLRAGSANALNSLEQAIDSLEQEIRTDEE